MTITADTNLLVRLIIRDDAQQTQLAQAELERATAVILTLPALCEACWVLRGYYRLGPTELVAAVQALIDAPNIRTDIDAVLAGIACLGSGGDFADGVIAASGAALGGETFVSFDQKAVRLLAEAGHSTRLLA